MTADHTAYIVQSGPSGSRIAEKKMKALQTQAWQRFLYGGSELRRNSSECYIYYSPFFDAILSIH
jgi:hypothetical protein